MKQADSSLLFPLLMKALERCVSPQVYTIHKFSLLEEFEYGDIFRIYVDITGYIKTSLSEKFS